LVPHASVLNRNFIVKGGVQRERKREAWERLELVRERLTQFTIKFSILLI
jgi:hypothetical protein